MFSFLVYSYNEAYINYDDNVVSAFAQGELVLIYFGALAIFATEEEDHRSGTFSGEAFGVAFIVIFFSSAIVAIGVILLDTFGYKDLRQARKEITDSIVAGSLAALSRKSSAPLDRTANHAVA